MKELSVVGRRCSGEALRAVEREIWGDGDCKCGRLLGEAGATAAPEPGVTEFRSSQKSLQINFLRRSSGKDLGDRVPALLEIWNSVPLSFLTLEIILITVRPLRSL